ncbi:hypothetical protein [Clostridium thermopalmarium]|uniref:Lipoprotein n=1 Tax=Clostridium thermopalmarium DSM 5974 TaxID=1121340 RepID=A0A2T0AT63_9CLOT|nr:hypothetical protein [Clostridium thermopalmarium]PRR73365.1 hypothetical protein CPAL_12510 [Clostridium thermopalmarium DSM 5974]PVZ22149.1 hypothetical protein LX19_01898 [Clostridium thermopalmarium DSM 5974]
MKKCMSYILIFTLIFTLIGCTEKKAENVREKDRFDIKAANDIVESYIKNIALEKYDKANELLSEKVKTDVKDIKPNDLKIKGFRTEEMSENAGEGNFRLNVVKANMNKPETQIVEYKFKVIKDGIDYKIEEIKTTLLMEAFHSFDEIRFRKKSELDTFLLTDMEGLPKYAYSKDDSAQMKSQIVPKSSFGPIVLDYTGDIVAISTIGNGRYIGLLTFDDSMETQGQGGGGGGSGVENPNSSGAGGEQRDTQSRKMPKEKPIGKQIVSCDIMENAVIENMIFSKDEKLLAVQYSKDGNRSIRVYNVGDGELIKFNFEEEYPLNKVNIVLRGFEEETMKYTIVPKDKQNGIEKYVGNWELDLKEFKAKKSES